MAYDLNLAQRVRNLLAGQDSVEEKKMMGGLTFMVHGKMCLGVFKNDVMVRIDPELYDEALSRNGCREMTFTGKPMKGFVLVGPAGTDTDTALKVWIDLGLDFNKRAKASRKRR